MTAWYRTRAWVPPALAVALVVGGCSTVAGPTIEPGSAAPASSTPAPTPFPEPSFQPSAPGHPTAARAPSGHLAFPSVFEVELVPGRYWSAPPFEIGFSFEVDKPGWISGHLNSEFFDIQRDADGGGPEQPQNILGFGLPAFVRGGTDIPVTDLTPAEAVAELEARSTIEASNVTAFELFGRPAVRVDLHAAVSSPIFGGPGGTFSLDPALDARLVFVPFDERLLLVLQMAAPADLEAAWTEVLPILESVDLP